MTNKSKVTSKQATYLFAMIFALIAIAGFVSLVSPGTPEAPAAGSETLPTNSKYSGYLFRVVAVTSALVVFLIVGLRIYRKQIQLSGKNNINLNLLGRYYLNDKQYLLKVTIDDRNLLLGVSDSSINLITELDLDRNDDSDEPTPFGRVLDLETNKETQV